MYHFLTATVLSTATHESSAAIYILRETSNLLSINSGGGQGLSQDLETGCLKLAMVNFLGDHNILRFQP